MLANASTTQPDTGSYELGVSALLVGPKTALVASVLPTSRNVQAGAAATVFATIINAGDHAGTGCGIALATELDIGFDYQRTDTMTNRPVGAVNETTSVDPGGAQSFMFTLTPRVPLDPFDLAFEFACTNSTVAPTITGLNTRAFSASTEPVVDMIALVATAVDPGIINVPSGEYAAFSVATANVGAPGTVSTRVRSTIAHPSVTTLACQTEPATRCYINPDEPTFDPVSVVVGEADTPTYASFIASDASIPFAPATSCLVIEFLDTDGDVRGATSVAVRSAVASEDL